MRKTTRVLGRARTICDSISGGRVCECVWVSEDWCLTKSWGSHNMHHRHHLPPTGRCSIKRLRHIPIEQRLRRDVLYFVGDNNNNNKRKLWTDFAIRGRRAFWISVSVGCLLGAFNFSVRNSTDLFLWSTSFVCFFVASIEMQTNFVHSGRRHGIRIALSIHIIDGVDWTAIICPCVSVSMLCRNQQPFDLSAISLGMSYLIE